MGGWSNRTMESETFPRAVTFNSVSLWIISAELSESVHPAQTQPSYPCQSIRLWKCVQLVSRVQRGNLKAPGVNTHDVKYAAGTCWECWYRGQPLFFFLVTMNLKLRESYRGALQFHRLSSAQSSHNSELQRRCPGPIYFLWGRGQTRAHQRHFIPGDTALN